MKKEFWLLLLKAMIYGLCIWGIIVGINVAVDASSVIRPKHMEMAKLALAGNIVSVPNNYNERVYQVCIVENIDCVPETIVIGNSRGMYLGKETTGYDDIYNNCVSGGCIEDYYALLGLYYDKFHKLPLRVIMEVSPWIFYGDIPETRWKEDDKYRTVACSFYKTVNGSELETDNSEPENPYISIAYFRYNIGQWKGLGNKVFEEEIAHISMDESEQADFPDGTIRYNSDIENESDERTERVISGSKGAYTYQNSDQMTAVDIEKAEMFESLVSYLMENGTEVIFYMSPFSVTQCFYSLDENLNPGYILAYDYIKNLAEKNNIEVHGGYDARDFGLTDCRFIDCMHLDKEGTKIVWSSSNN